MKKLLTLAAAAGILALGFAPANAADLHYRDRAPVVHSGPNPLMIVLGGAAVGAIIGAVVCPPCSIAGTALTTAGAGALVGAGVGAVGGTIIAVSFDRGIGGQS